MRVRIRFAKLGKVRWTSHRDVARMWERAFRRVELPLAYTGGFSPRPKVSFGLALPTGHESVAEYLDVELAEEVEGLAALPGRLSAALPGGVDALAAVTVAPGTASLQADVAECTWSFTASPVSGGDPVGTAELTGRVADLLARPEAVVTRHRKAGEVQEDIRPGILALRVTDRGRVEADLAAQPRSLRPADVLAALHPDWEERDVRRLHQWIRRDGARWEPVGLASDATGAPHATVRAS